MDEIIEHLRAIERLLRKMARQAGPGKSVEVAQQWRPSKEASSCSS